MEFLVVMHLLIIVFMLQSFLSQCHLRNSSWQCIHVVVIPARIYMCNCVFPASATPTCVIYV